MKKILWVLAVVAGIGGIAFAASFNPTATYNTVVDIDGKAYAYQAGMYYDAQGNSWPGIPPSRNGYVAVSMAAVNPSGITLNGAVPATLTNPTLQATNSVDNYTQISIQNKSATANASADLIAYPDNVTSSDLTGFMDMGITSSAFSQAAYAITGANEGYLFMSAPSGAGKSGNMIIATDSTGSSNNIVFGTNGFSTLANRRMTIFGTGRVAIGSNTDDGVNSLQVTGAARMNTNLTVGASSLTLGTGSLGVSKMTASASAPGATGGKLEMVCGTNSGTAKLIMYAGTSASPITIIDNVGSGVTGC